MLFRSRRVGILNDRRSGSVLMILFENYRTLRWTRLILLEPKRPFAASGGPLRIPVGILDRNIYSFDRAIQYAFENAPRNSGPKMSHNDPSLSQFSHPYPQCLLLMKAKTISTCHTAQLGKNRHAEKCIIPSVVHFIF